MGIEWKSGQVVEESGSEEKRNGWGEGSRVDGKKGREWMDRSWRREGRRD